MHKAHLPSQNDSLLHSIITFACSNVHFFSLYFHQIHWKLFILFRRINLNFIEERRRKRVSSYIVHVKHIHTVNMVYSKSMDDDHMWWLCMYTYIYIYIQIWILWIGRLSVELLIWICTQSIFIRFFCFVLKNVSNAIEQFFYSFAFELNQNIYILYFIIDNNNEMRILQHIFFCSSFFFYIFEYIL